MGVFRTQDSLRKCDPNHYSSIYDVRNHPSIKPNKIEKGPVRKDSIDFSKKKIEEDAFKRLNNASKSAGKVVPAVKFVLMVLVFPPYMIFYRLPQLVSAEAIPVVDSSCQWIWKKIKELARKQMEPVNQVFIQTIKYFEKAKKALITPIVHIAVAIQKKLRRLREKALQLIRQEFQKVASFFGEPLKRLRSRMSGRLNQLKKLRKSGSDKLLIVSEMMQKGIQFLRDAPYMFRDWGIAQIDNLKTSLVSFQAKWENRLSKSRALSLRMTNQISNFFSRGKAGMENLFQPIQKFVKEMLLPPWRKFTGSIASKWSHIVKFIEDKHRQAITFLQKKNEKLMGLSPTRLLQKLSEHPLLAKLPKFWQSLLKRILSHPITQFLIKMGVRTYSLLGRLVILAIKFCLDVGAHGAISAKKGLAILRSSLVRVSASLNRSLQTGLSYLQKLAFTIMYYFLLVGMMGIILIGMGVKASIKSMDTLTRLKR